MDKELAVKRDMRRSIECVKRYSDVISSMLNGGRILPVEGSDDEVCRHLDLTCGTDYLHVYDNSNGLTWGVASRFQFDYDYTRNGDYVLSFTVRTGRESGARTEYEKRMYAISHGGIYPYLQLHGYIDPYDNLIAIGIARTIDVLECIDTIGHASHTKHDKTGQASFKYVEWNDMVSAGYKVLVHRPK